MGDFSEANGRTVGTALEDKGNLFYRYHPSSNSKELARLFELGELAYMRDKQRVALQWMKEHPNKTIKLIAHRFRFYWFPPKDMWGKIHRTEMEGNDNEHYLVSWASYL